MNRFFAFPLAALLLAGAASAAPFAQWFNIRQPDGSVIRIWDGGHEIRLPPLPAAESLATRSGDPIRRDC